MEIQHFYQIHPVVVHFPIALLGVAPLFIIIGMMFAKHLRPFFVCALILMILGAGFMFLAQKSGEAAYKNLQKKPTAEGYKVLDSHAKNAKVTTIIFAAAATLFLILVLLPLAFTKLSPKAYNIIVVIFILMYCGALIMLAITGHDGALAVHKYGASAGMK